MDCHEKTKQFANVRVIKKDISHITSLEDLEETTPFDVILSDMAPRTTGIKTVDQTKSFELIETVFNLLPFLLKKKGHLVAKFFEGPDIQVFLKKEKRSFDSFHFLRVQSSRRGSREVFVIGKGFGKQSF